MEPMAKTNTIFTFFLFTIASLNVSCSPIFHGVEGEIVDKKSRISLTVSRVDDYSIKIKLYSMANNGFMSVSIDETYDIAGYKGQISANYRISYKKAIPFIGYNYLSVIEVDITSNTESLVIKTSRGHREYRTRKRGLHRAEIIDNKIIVYFKPNNETPQINFYGDDKPDNLLS